MTDQKKRTLEGDLLSAAHELQVAANQDQRLREHREDLSRRLLKWADGKDPNEQPFDFQRSYDRGVRRFVQRNGLVTGGLHWFKDDGLFYPVRDGSGYGWTDTGHHQLTLKEHPRDLIAEAPAEVQQEDAD